MNRQPIGDANLSAWPCVRSIACGAVLDVSVVPGAKRTEAVGLHDKALRLRLAAPPVDGKANEALLTWLSQQLQCARCEVRLLRGASVRRKQIALDMPMERVVAWLRERLMPH